MATSEPTKGLPYPVVTAEKIEENLKEVKHFLTPSAVRTSTCISDLAGMSGMGIHKINLGPNVESTTIHYHLIDSEWLYILSGSAILLLVDASSALVSLNPNKDAPPQDQLQVKEVIVKTGDFIGFQGGEYAAQYAHGLRGGPEGVEYICGGTREPVDICNYPLKGKTRLINKINRFGVNADSTAFVPKV